MAEAVPLKSRAVDLALGTGILALFLVIPNLVSAQPAPSLAGSVRDASGKPLAKATVHIRNSETGNAIDVESDLAGSFSASNLPSGDYEISADAEGFEPAFAKAVLVAGRQFTLSLVLNAKSAAPSPQELPNAPSSAQQPSLGDLGFTPQQTEANPQFQAMLEKRTEMLRIHQRLGLITAIPMAAAVITGPMAKAKGKNGQTITEPTNGNLDFHAALGGATAGLYFSTAYFAIFAPRVPGTKKHGAIRVHEALAFIHGPGMILTPVLGAMAYNQENSGEKAHGIAAQHGTVAYITAAAYGASIVAVSWPIHVKFWEKK